MPKAPLASVNNSPTSGSTRRRWIALAGAAACAPVTRLLAAPSATIIQHAAEKEGFYANSYLLEGERECLLIDAHLNGREAAELSPLIQRTKKPLSAIVITHPHPDHFLGLEVLGPLYPDATVFSSLGTLEFVRQAARHWNGFSNSLVGLTQGPVTLAAQQFDCLLPLDAESASPVVLFDPTERTLIAGDHILNGQHHWLVEGRGKAWRKNLETIGSRWTIDQILPGHGAIGGAGLIRASDDYIAQFLKLQREGRGSEHAFQLMTEIYPDFVFPRALRLSISANF